MILLGHLREANEVTTKMAEQIQLQHVTTKDPKKVEQSNRLAEWNRGRREKNWPKLRKEGTEANLLLCCGYCSHWGVRCSWILHLVIQEPIRHDSGLPN